MTHDVLLCSTYRKLSWQLRLLRFLGEAIGLTVAVVHYETLSVDEFEWQSSHSV